MYHQSICPKDTLMVMLELVTNSYNSYLIVRKIVVIIAKSLAV